jgi:glyoxylate utilization-related uncharacterized protein
MILVKAREGTPYDAPKHFNMWAMKKVTPEFSLRTTVGISQFLPTGGAELSSSNSERVYYVIAGSITVSGKGETHVLDAGDLVYIAPGEEREISVNNREPATVLVVVVTP